MKHKKIVFLLVFFSFLPLLAWAQTFNYTPLEKIPGFESQTTGDFYTYISLVYKFGIWAVGIAALFMLIWGGYMYIASAGNNSTMEKAKGVITDALIGLLLALSAYLILYIINPDLVKSTPTGSAPPPGGGGQTQLPGQCTGTDKACCKAGTSCGDCSGCSATGTAAPYNYSNMCYKGAPGNTGCQLNSGLKSKLANVNWSVGGGAQVSEAWPPTVYHSSACHGNGTCADVRCNSGCKNIPISDVKKIYDALRAAGLNVLFETTNCKPYKDAGITNCSSPGTMTSPSFHVS